MLTSANGSDTRCRDDETLRATDVGGFGNDHRSVGEKGRTESGVGRSCAKGSVPAVRTGTRRTWPDCALSGRPGRSLVAVSKLVMLVLSLVRRVGDGEEWVVAAAVGSATNVLELFCAICGAPVLVVLWKGRSGEGDMEGSGGAAMENGSASCSKLVPKLLPADGGF